MMRPICRLAIAAALILLTWSAAAVRAAGTELVLAVVPQFPALDIHRTWTPIAKTVEIATGRTVRLKIYPSIPVFEQDFMAGVPDIVYLNPFHMVMAHRARGYVPLVRDSAQQLSGILLVQAGSSITNVAELEGRQIAFPAPNAFGASLLLRALLTEQFHIGFSPNYVRTHSNAYRYVARGEMAAAGGIRSTFEREPEDLRSKLKVLYETPRFASHPVAVHPRLAADLRATIARTFLQMRATEAGRAELAAVALSEPVMAEYRRDYGVLEKLGLERHAVLEN